MGMECTYREADIIREDDLLPDLHFLGRVLLCDPFHAPRIARLQIWTLLIELARISVLHAEWLYLKPHDAGQVCLNITMVQDSKPQVVVEVHNTVLQVHSLCFSLSESIH
jgi:hypothetical protein